MENLARYYGYYSNGSRGKRQKEDLDDAIPCILDHQGNEKDFRKSWARLIQKIYEVDPLICPKCKGAMRVISSIEPSVIRAILEHQGLWLARARPPPKIHDLPVRIHGSGRGRLPQPSRMTSRRSPFMTIISMGTLNIPGTIILKHNAS